MHILFVGSANRERTRTAQEYFTRVFPQIEFDSCGINPLLVEETREHYWPDAKCVSQALISWAHLIICMEELHREYIVNQFALSDRDRTRVWHVRDIFAYNDSELLSGFETIVWYGHHNPPPNANLSNIVIRPTGELGDRTK